MQEQIKLTLKLTNQQENELQFDINWNIIAWPGLAWAKRMFPDWLKGCAIRLAEASLWLRALMRKIPLHHGRHIIRTKREKGMVKSKRFQRDTFQGPGTDLKIGLADDHEWMGGASMAQNGVICNPNIPSEEVFTTHTLELRGMYLLLNRYRIKER